MGIEELVSKESSRSSLIPPEHCMGHLHQNHRGLGGSLSMSLVNCLLFFAVVDLAVSPGRTEEEFLTISLEICDWVNSQKRDG